MAFSKDVSSDSSLLVYEYGHSYVVGVQFVDYTNPSTGKNTKGVRVYCIAPLKDSVGFSASDYFIYNGDPSQYHIGEMITPTFHMSGDKAYCDGIVYK